MKEDGLSWNYGGDIFCKSNFDYHQYNSIDELLRIMLPSLPHAVFTLGNYFAVGSQGYIHNLLAND